MRRSASLWLHRTSNIAILPIVVALAIIFGVIIGPIERVAEVVKIFRKHWGDKA